MDQHEIEQLIGHLYLLLAMKDKEIAALREQIPAGPKPPTIFAMATPREE